MDNNENLERFMLETKTDANDAHSFFEQNKDINNIDDIIDLYIKKNKIECHICLEKCNKLYMFIPCGHKIICNECAQQYLSKYTDCLHTNIDKCPICREKWSMISEKKPLCVPPSNNENNNETIDIPSLLFIEIHHEIMPIMMEGHRRMTKICKFYKNGYCVRGENCCYRHLEQYNNIQRVTKKEDYCKHFLENWNCNYGELCFFIHDILPTSLEA
jgi:hypothetical protein